MLHPYYSKKDTPAAIVIGGTKKNAPYGAFSNPASRSRSLAWFRSALVAACRPITATFC